MAVATFGHGGGRIACVEKNRPAALFLWRKLCFTPLDLVELAIGANERALELRQCFGRSLLVNRCTRESLLEKPWVFRMLTKSCLDKIPMITHLKAIAKRVEGLFFKARAASVPENTFIMKSNIEETGSRALPILPAIPLLTAPPSVKANAGWWQLAQLIVLSSDSIGSKKSALPKATPS